MVDDNAYSEYDDFLAKASKDNRVGDHEFMVTDIKSGKWSDLKPGLSNDPYYKVTGSLLSAGKAKVDFTWSPPPPAAELEKMAEAGEMTERQEKAIATSISLAKQMAQFYGAKVQELRVGDTFRVKTVKNKEGFVRIVAVLPKGDGAKAAPVDSAEPPF